MTATDLEDGLLRGIAEREAHRLCDGTLPWTWWLEQAARYGRYGFVNTLLIAAQWRAATDVRSYDEWRRLGRQVRKGEAGIRILSARGRPYAVFDLAQTDGLPYERPPRPAPALDAVQSLVPDVRQFEADSIAYLVLRHYGLDATHLTFPPVAEWAGGDPLAAVREAGDRILRMAAHLCRGLDEMASIQVEAHQFFAAEVTGSWVPSYLADRGFRDVVIDGRVGYAPKGWRGLTDHLRRLGHSDDAIVESGLARRGRRGLYDTFRDRAMFAMRRVDGTIVGFIGRRRGHAEGPKYLNSPETPLFRKSELLFGLYEGRERLAEQARPVVVEGPFDVLAVNSASESHAAIGLCGTRLTTAQLDQVGGLDQIGLIVALDGDEAGRAAAVRLWDVLGRVNGPVDIARLPPGQDPASLMRRHGPGALREALRLSHPLADVVVDAAVDRMGLGTPEERIAAVRAAVSVIAGLPLDQVARQVGRVAGRLDTDAAVVTAELTAIVSPDRHGE